MAPTNAERFQEKRNRIAAIMGEEEKQAGSFHQLRESYHKMLLCTFSLRSEASLWKKAHRLATRDYLARVSEMRAVYVGVQGDTAGFQAPRLYYLAQCDFNPIAANAARESAEGKPLQLTEQVNG